LKLSIITINLNNIHGLKETIASVLKQSFKHFEFIVIDGNSTDGSAELIAQQTKDFSYCISENDTGVYHAQNKGIVKANGTFLLFLNSGDVLADPDILSRIFSLPLEEDIIYGDVFYKDAQGSQLKKYDAALTFSHMFQDGLPHQGSFIKKSLFDKIGIYDQSLKLSADWKFFIQALFIHGATSKYVDEAIAVYDASGMSSDPKNTKQMFDERRAVLQEFFPRFIKDYDELFMLRSKYKLIKNSRYIKTALVIKKCLPIQLIKRLVKK
jgi:glycosyltransferase involved in cell wall biosynthesis